MTKHNRYSPGRHFFPPSSPILKTSLHFRRDTSLKKNGPTKIEKLAVAILPMPPSLQ